MASFTTPTPTEAAKADMNKAGDESVDADDIELQAAILEHAKYLGMDIENEDKDFLWLGVYAIISICTAIMAHAVQTSQIVSCKPNVLIFTHKCSHLRFSYELTLASISYFGSQGSTTGGM